MGNQQHNAQLIEAMGAHFVRKPERFGATVRRAAAGVVIATGAWAAITFDDNATWPETYDWANTYTTAPFPGGPYPFWAVANPTRLTIPAPASMEMGNLAGEYIVTGHLYWQSNVAGFRQIAIKVTRPPAVAVFVAIDAGHSLGAQENTPQSIARKLWLNPGDYVELFGRQTSGGNLAPLSYDEFGNYFTIGMIR